MDALVQVMTAFVVLSALAMIAQAAMVFGMFRAVKELKSQMAVFLPKAESFLVTSQKTMEDNRQQIAEITTKASLIMDNAHKQITRVDTVTEELSTRLKAQFDRAELVLDDTITRVHGTVMMLNNGVLKPIREVNGFAAGLRAGVQYLLKGSRPSVAQATADEEMFI
jgi:ABC-type Na+ efflux pump permease subunit